MKIIVTGGAGFIGSELVRHIIKNTEYTVVNVDKLTYSGNLQSLASIESNENYIFKQIDICNENELKKPTKKNLLKNYKGIKFENWNDVLTQIDLS